MAARGVSARDSNRRGRVVPIPVSNELVRPVDPETGYLVTITSLGKRFSTNFITWTVITDDPEQAIHLVKQRLCLRGYENKYSFKTVKVTIVEKNGIAQGIPIEVKTEEPVHNN